MGNRIFRDTIVLNTSSSKIIIEKTVMNNTSSKIIIGKMVMIILITDQEGTIAIVVVVVIEVMMAIAMTGIVRGVPYHWHGIGNLVIIVDHLINNSKAVMAVM